MEAVGARQGRISSRYGQTTVFTGPVRKWKKTWIHVAPPSSNGGGRRDGANSGGGNVMLFKWTPISEENGGGDDDEMATGEGVDRTRKKVRFVPIALLEEQEREAAEHAEEEAKGMEADPSTDEQASKSSTADEKPDMNDTPMEDNEEVGADGEQVERQDLNKTAVEGNISQSKTDEE